MVRKKVKLSFNSKGISIGGWFSYDFLFGVLHTLSLTFFPLVIVHASR